MRENIKWWLLFFSLTVYKSSHPPVLAQRWMTGLRTRPKNEHKSEAKASRYANAWEGLRECEARSNPVSKNVVRIDLRNYCGSAKHAAIW